MQGVGLALVPGPIAKAPIADGRLQALLTPRGHHARGFSLSSGQTSGLAQIARLHRAHQKPERRRPWRRNQWATVAQGRSHQRPLIGCDTLSRCPTKSSGRDSKFKSTRRRRSVGRGQSRGAARRDTQPVNRSGEKRDAGCASSIAVSVRNPFVTCLSERCKIPVTTRR